jgi:hypothetical protein
LTEGFLNASIPINVCNNKKSPVTAGDFLLFFFYQAASQPPSAGTMTPLTKRDSSETRKSASLAVLLVSPIKVSSLGPVKE